MNKKNQRIVSIIIGLTLAALLVYIGFRIVQRRGAAASNIKEVTATRDLASDASGQTCMIEVTTTSSDRLLFKYGSSATSAIQVDVDALPFFAALEPTDSTDNGDGTYTFKKSIPGVSLSDVVFALAEDGTINDTCPAYTGGNDSTSSATDTNAEDFVQEQLEPTTAPEPATDTTDTSESLDSGTSDTTSDDSGYTVSGICTLEQTQAFYDNNSSATTQECVGQISDDQSCSPSFGLCDQVRKSLDN